MKKLFEVKISAYIQCWAETEEEAINFAKEVLHTVEPENVESSCDFVTYSLDDISVLNVEETDDESMD